MDIFQPSEDSRRTIAESFIHGNLLLHGWPHAWRSGDRAAAMRAAQSALDGLIVLGLAYRESPPGHRLFDPVEVSNFLHWAGLNLGDPTLDGHYIPAQRQLIFDTHALHGGHAPPPPPHSLGARRFRVTLHRRFNLAGLRPDKRARLHLPLPSAGAELRDLAITPLLPEATPPNAPPIETRMTTGRLEILTPVPPPGEITVGMVASFTAYPSPPEPQNPEPLSPADTELYTRPTEGLIRITDRIRTLANDLAGDATEPMTIIARFWDFIMGQFYIDAIHHDRLDPAAPLDTALDQGIANCLVGSGLMVALCRSRGLPARIATGYILNPCAPGYHSWFEVWVDGAGWRSFDLMGWDLTTDFARPNGWRDYYFGQVDHRMVTERPPRQFVGAGDVRLPARWHILNYPEGEGTMIEFRTIDTGALIYADHITVEWLKTPIHP